MSADVPRHDRTGVPGDLVGARVTVGSETYIVLRHGHDAAVLTRSLTEAELQVALGVLAGRSNGEIARSRGTSLRTVANQLRSLYDKLGVRTRTELAARWPGVEVSRDS